jgi:hypothetical protein
MTTDVIGDAGLWQGDVYSVDGEVGVIDLTGKYATISHGHNASEITEDSSRRFVSDAEKAVWNAKQDELGFTPENSANKGVANGYAALDGSGKVPVGQLPADVVTSVDGQIGAVDLSGVYSPLSHGHAATEITEDATHRFVTDTEKTIWSGKEDGFSKNSAFNRSFEASAAEIKKDAASASVGVSDNIARADHAHPSSLLESWSVKTDNAIVSSGDIFTTVEYQNAANDRIFTIDAGITQVGAWLYIKKTGSGDVTIARSGVTFSGASGNVDIELDGQFAVYFVYRGSGVWEYSGPYQDV